VIRLNTRIVRKAVAVLAVAAAVAPVTPALAVTPSKAAAVKAAKARAASLAKQTHASGYRVVGCRKSTSVRYYCQVENSFNTGAKRCTADVVVSFKGGRTRTTYSNYVCY
jgi:hypothetical protein